MKIADFFSPKEDIRGSNRGRWERGGGFGNYGHIVSQVIYLYQIVFLVKEAIYASKTTKRKESKTHTA
jgi:hypothetical protein